MSSHPVLLDILKLSIIFLIISPCFNYTMGTTTEKIMIFKISPSIIIRQKIYKVLLFEEKNIRNQGRFF